MGWGCYKYPRELMKKHYLLRQSMGKQYLLDYAQELINERDSLKVKIKKLKRKIRKL